MALHTVKKNTKKCLEQAFSSFYVNAKKKQKGTFKKVHVYCTRVTIDLKELGKSVYLAKSVLEGFFFLWCARKSILRQEPT